jgi:hypothetical protein
VGKKSYLLFGLLLASCVPVTRFEEAESAAQVEAEARRRAAHELEASRKRVAELEASLKARESELESRKQALDEQQLATNLSAKDGEEKASLVEQLRGELARSGEHIRAYSDEKSRLEQELQAAQRAEQAQKVDQANGDPSAPAPTAQAPAARSNEVSLPPAGPPDQPDQRAPAPDLGALARLVSTALSAVGLDGQVKVSTNPDAVELEIAEKSLFEPDSAALRQNMLALFAAAARLSSYDPSFVAATSPHRPRGPTHRRARPPAAERPACAPPRTPAPPSARSSR